MQLTSRLRAAVALVAALMVLLPACGFSHGPSFDIGFRRIALDLSYKDDALAPLPTPEQAAMPQPVLSDAFFATNFGPVKVPVPHPNINPLFCAAAGADAHPEQPATVFATTPPAIGTYFLHNTGSFTLGTGITAKFQLPLHSYIQIKNVVRSDTDDPVNGPTSVITWDVDTPGLSGTTTVTYRTTFSPAALVSTVSQTAQQSHAPQGELDLVHLVIRTADTTVDFLPTPPVTLMAFKTGQGTNWKSSGVDQRNGTAMVVQGSVTQRKNIDVCGTIYDTYEVVSNEQIANLQTGLSSQTDPNDPNVYDIATQYGGMVVHQHINTTTSFPTSGAPTVIASNYDQTLDSIAPIG